MGVLLRANTAVSITVRHQPRKFLRIGCMGLLGAIVA